MLEKRVSILPRALKNIRTWQTKTKKLLKFARFALYRLERDRLPQVASSLTLTSILSMVPLLALVLAVFTAFPQFNELQITLEQWLDDSLIPDDITNFILTQLTQFASNASSLKALGGFLFVLFSVSIIHQIEVSLSEIWRVKYQRSWLQRFLVYWGILTLGPIMLALSVWTSSNLSNNFIQQIAWWPGALGLVMNVFSLLISTVFFAAIFVVVPNCHVAWRDALVGGAVTALFLELFGAAFGLYVGQVSTLHVVYGAFATVPIFIIWLRYSWIVILLGATVTASMPYIRWGRWDVSYVPGRYFMDAINILGRLEEQRHSIEPGLNTFVLSNQLRLSTNELLSILNTLLQEGWVIRVGEGQKECWVMIRDPASINMEQLIKLWLFNPERCNQLGGLETRACLARAIATPGSVSLEEFLQAREKGCQK